MVLVISGAITGVMAPSTSAKSRPTRADNFVIRRYDVSMQLQRDQERHAHLTTTLKITADFPPQQNHGIAPIFVTQYDGHSTQFELQSVTDEHGHALEHRWHGNELRIGSASTYVSGQKTYVIRYSQRDVTKWYQDVGRQEFYWNAIGTDWRVPIDQATVSLQVSPDLTQATQTDLQCYRGLVGSQAKCQVKTDERGVMSATIYNLPRSAGVTVAIGFQAGTFADYQPTLGERLLAIWLSVQLVACLLAGVAAIVLAAAYIRSVRRTKELAPIVPEYIPPKDTSLSVSAAIVGSLAGVRGSVMTAQLLDLAVRHYIRIYQTKPKRLLRPAEYEVEIMRAVDSLKDEEQELLRDMFGKTPAVGAVLNLKKLSSDSAYAGRIVDNDRKLRQLITQDYQLKALNPAHKTRFRRYSLWLLVIGLLLLSPALLGLALVARLMAGGKVLTDKGLALRRYLFGLKYYIGVAEAERLKLLQSPDGAAKVAAAGVQPDDQKQLVKLYERVLPYAVLFGQEKQWTKQIGHYYEQAGTQPDWYRGDGAFNAALFASSISQFTSVAAASTSPASSGGSSGGGFVGGGGGGGGGGGW